MSDKDLLSYLITLNIDRIVDDVNTKCTYNKEKDENGRSSNKLTINNLNRTYCYQWYTEFGYCSSCAKLEPLMKRIAEIMDA
jgi:hypothetical protein